jgi:hypothetical protein
VFPTVSHQELRQGRSNDVETFGLANATRRAVNMTSRVRATFTNSDTGVYVDAWVSDEVPEGALWTVVASVLGKTSIDRCRFQFTGCYYRQPAGTLSQEGIVEDVTTPIDSSGSLFDARFLIVGNVLSVQVYDNTGNGETNWDVLVEAREIT